MDGDHQHGRKHVSPVGSWPEGTSSINEPLTAWQAPTPILRTIRSDSHAS
jgi:hypothetical protein